MDRYGLIGKNISYSFSKQYFASKFERERITNASYVNFDCQTIEEVVSYLLNPNIRGFNVTIPYKEAVIPYLDDLAPDAHAIGAVNTIKRTQTGDLIGYNTDFIGFKDSLTERLGDALTTIPSPKKALILGTGGASKAVVFALTTLGFSCMYVSRSPSEGVLSYQDLTASIVHSYTLIVNCTPLGTFPNIGAFPAIPYHELRASHILYDLIYNPKKTVFLEKGEQQGAIIISGLRMLELQAEAAWEIWTA
ncbi:shikimate dehydrogenase family protein [Dokdonia ponticola]|uniref:Shikimate dehydrogenase family protein n=1 Tax=Dokdonia ponticola TaxID=2041041 RepID=A0ABV9I0L8_9FLAO